MKKYNYLFKTEFKKYLLLRDRIEKEIVVGINHFENLEKRTPFENQIIPLNYYLLEINSVIVECFKNGFISSGLNHLRLEIEIVNKIFVFGKEEKLAEKTKITPREIRAKMKKYGYPDWKKIYSDLCDVSHHNLSFLKAVYPTICHRGQITKESKIFIEYYMMIMNVLTIKSVSVIFNHLKNSLPVEEYNAFYKRQEVLGKKVNEDWNYVHEKQNKMKDLIKKGIL